VRNTDLVSLYFQDLLVERQPNETRNWYTELFAEIAVDSRRTHRLARSADRVKQFGIVRESRD